VLVETRVAKKKEAWVGKRAWLVRATDSLDNGKECEQDECRELVG